MGCVKTEYGYCYYEFEQDSKGDYVHIYNLYVLPKYRRHGHAKDILNKAITAIKKVGYEHKIQIVAQPEEDCISRKKLKAFYESLGLRVFDCYM